jgi:putative glutamine amidotransferase
MWMSTLSPKSDGAAAVQHVLASRGRKPIIGIPASIAAPNAKGYIYQQVGAPYLAAIEQAGAIPLMLPVTADRSLMQGLLECVDGVLFQGGGDLYPGLYGQDSTPEVQTWNLATDEFELRLCRECVAVDRPVLAICRGLQVLNVAMGGTLVQDIPSQRPGPVQHRQSGQREQPTHAIEVQTGSLLRDILCEDRLYVNSLHHQSVDRLGSGLSVSARSEDGVVEGLELPGKRFTVAVQFHPEELLKTVESMSRLFGALVESARADREDRWPNG